MSCHYNSLLVENRSAFAEILQNIYKERSQSNENLQIIIEELRHGIKTMKNGRSFEPGRIVPHLVKCREEYLNRYLFQLIDSCLRQNEIKTVERIVCDIII